MYEPQSPGILLPSRLPISNQWTARMPRGRDAPQRVHSKPATEKIGFLDFPRELRDMVYAYALMTKSVIALETIETRFPNPGTVLVAWLKDPESVVSRCQLKPRIEPGAKPSQDVRGALLRISRQIHDEAAPFLYSQNEFRIADWADAAAIIAPTYRYLVRKISLEFVRRFYITDRLDVAETWWSVAGPINHCFPLFPNLTKFSLVFDMHPYPIGKRWFDGYVEGRRFAVGGPVKAEILINYLYKCLQPVCRLKLNGHRTPIPKCLSIKFVPMFNAYGWRKEELAQIRAEEDAVNSAFKRIQALEPVERKPSVTTSDFFDTNFVEDSPLDEEYQAS